MTFGERFSGACQKAAHPLCLGLDPRVDEMPDLIRARARAADGSPVRRAIAEFHELAIAAAVGLVPAVKLQMAFYEQYGIAGQEGHSAIPSLRPVAPACW